ncbi:phage tail protein [Desulfovibrio psychrotolerans]|uniref:Phage tail fibre protein N-terminal domain-containing protein n=1 Tax=Desulfovibrio psychrotolerans TaxID=415242 RepID=A0A7J0BVM5_9BACT|nr:phage tail protein [Desulfovibrio psychrotolerans]GFM37723.1 hypothetical protein DSM19430T_24070 [Desulfovibrio psychrotolerans]
MATAITFAGESLIASKQAAGLPLVLDTFVLALVPGQDPNVAVDRSEGMPNAGTIVHTYAIPEEYRGFVNPNQVVYSMLLGSDLGDFTFNWLGLYSSADDVVVAISHLPEIAKWKTDLGTNTAGNNLTRNMLLEFSGAQAATGIIIQAATWQIDFTARLRGIDERERTSNRDIYGRALFWGDACKVGNDGALTLQPGTSYIEGIPVRYTVEQPVQAGAVVSKDVWLDVSLQAQGSDVVAVVVPVVVDTGTAQADYTDGASVRHYLVQLASIDAGGAVTDLRPALGVQAIADNVVAWIAGRTAADMGAAEAEHVHLTEEIVDLLPDPHQWLAGQRYPVTTLVAVDAAVTWDMAANPVAMITLTDAVTTVTLTNAQPGATYELTALQDATGGRSIAFPAAVRWPGGTALEVTQDANAEDLIMFSVRGSVGSPVVRGFAALTMQAVA